MTHCPTRYFLNAFVYFKNSWDHYNFWKLIWYRLRKLSWQKGKYDRIFFNVLNTISIYSFEQMKIVYIDHLELMDILKVHHRYVHEGIMSYESFFFFHFSPDVINYSRHHPNIMNLSIINGANLKSQKDFHEIAISSRDDDTMNLISYHSVFLFMFLSVIPDLFPSKK